jgi:hypothetical protein
MIQVCPPSVGGDVWRNLGGNNKWLDKANHDYLCVVRSCKVVDLLGMVIQEHTRCRSFNGSSLLSPFVGALEKKRRCTLSTSYMSMLMHKVWTHIPVSSAGNVVRHRVYVRRNDWLSLRGEDWYATESPGSRIPGSWSITTLEEFGDDLRVSTV